MTIVITPHYQAYALDRTAVKITDAVGNILVYTDAGKTAIESTFVKSGEFSINIQYRHVSVECNGALYIWNEFSHKEGWLNRDKDCHHSFGVLK